MDFGKNNKEKRQGENRVDPTRREIINAEQPHSDAVEVLYDPHEPSPSGKSPAIMEQYNQASEPSGEMLKFRNYKRRQMNEFTDNYLFSQVIPSRAVTVINVINTFLLSIVLMIAFMVALGLLVGLRISIVPTDSMKDEISVGSLVITQPVASIEDIRVGDTLSYIKTVDNITTGYIHKVQLVDVQANRIYMVGANSDHPNAGLDVIAFEQVTGRLIVTIPYVGYVVAYVQSNFILVLAVFICVLIGMLLSRALIEKKHNDQEFKEFLDKKTEYERRAVEQAMLEKQKEDKIRFENMLHE